MCTYRNLFHVYTQGPHHVYTKVPDHPHVHRDSIMYAFKEVHHTLYTQGPISMHLGNSTHTHVLTGTPSCL